MIGRYGNSFYAKCLVDRYCGIVKIRRFFSDVTDQGQTVQKVHLISMSPAVY